MNKQCTNQIIVMIILSIGSSFYTYNQKNKLFAHTTIQEIQRKGQYFDKSDNNSNLLKEQKQSINHLELQVYRKINEYRIERGLTPLKLDNRISKLAKEYSTDMANKEVSFGGSNLDRKSEIIKQFMPYKLINEAISYNFGYTNPAQVTVDSWISDPRFIDALQGDYEFTGIGVARSLTGEYYFTQIFVRPL